MRHCDIACLGVLIMKFAAQKWHFKSTSSASIQNYEKNCPKRPNFTCHCFNLTVCNNVANVNRHVKGKIKGRFAVISRKVSKSIFGQLHPYKLPTNTICSTYFFIRKPFKSRFYPNRIYDYSLVYTAWAFSQSKHYLSLLVKKKDITTHIKYR